jgi:6-pyruvoyltetrahydropterin/6-carboxytetrahydropterin synthase
VTTQTQVISSSRGEFFRVTKEIEFDTGHRVPLHESKCRNPHGHRYKVKANVVGPIKSAGSETGMVVDFGYIKRLLTTDVHDVYDHGFVVQSTDTDLCNFLLDSDWNVVVVEFAPTAENLAKEIYDNLAAKVMAMGPDVFLESIEVYETPTSVAVYPVR